MKTFIAHVPAKALIGCLLVVTAGYGRLNAQCSDFTLNLTATPSTCQSNGTITVSVTGPDAANLRLSDAQYSIAPAASGTSYSQAWAQAPGGVLTGVPAGTYNVSIQAYCLNGS
ncbi:MAG: MliC family protein, partial [Tannerellaceae bacterium]|nr:MliC family protein [Tannerellaceae bacterium]